MEKEVITNLVSFRFEKAKKSLETAKKLYEMGDYGFSLNRAYYAVFDAMRAIEAIDGFDSSKHSGVISYFNLNYIKNKKFSVEALDIIKHAEKLCERSDYEDYFIAEEGECAENIKKVEFFINEVEEYLNKYFNN